MQSYYRLRLISMKGCHLLAYYYFFNTCRNLYQPHQKHIKLSVLIFNVLLVELEGIAPSSSVPIIIVVNDQFYVAVLDDIKSKLLYNIQVSVPDGDVTADIDSVPSLLI